MKHFVHLFFVPIFLLSCKSKNHNHYSTIRQGNLTLKGNIQNDTLFNDTISYYDNHNNLISKKEFKDGRQNGISIDYYNNGRPMIISSYVNGLKNGNNLYYDSSGKCYYRDFYYYDLIVGPIIYYDSSEIPKRYFFVNLQNETLLDINYKNWHGIKDIFSSCINLTANLQRVDSNKEIALLLYVIDPPKISFNYTIYKKKSMGGTGFVEIMKIKTKQPFVTTELPVLSKDENYVIGLNIFDSMLNKGTIIYKDF